MTSRPRVSILIPTRDRREYLEKSLASALEQTDCDIEVVISDDGSVDDTVRYVRAAMKQDNRIRLLTDNPAPGIIENVEHLIAHARGEFYTILGDDDLLDPDYCAALSAPFTDPRCQLSFCDHRVIDEAGKVMVKATERSSVRYGLAALSNGPVADPIKAALDGGVWLGFSMHRTAAFRELYFDRSCGTAADWDFAIRAAQRGGFFYVRRQLASYRDHRNTASRRRRADASRAALFVLTKYEFDDLTHESLRLDLLRDAAMRYTFHAAASDRRAAEHSWVMYRRLGGSLWSSRALLATVIRRLPYPAARAVYTTIGTGAALVSRSAQTVSLITHRTDPT
jgi:glycosyltransferase involved in cell wall biosynthesis